MEFQQLTGDSAGSNAKHTRDDKLISERTEKIVDSTSVIRRIVVEQRQSHFISFIISATSAGRDAKQCCDDKLKGESKEEILNGASTR